MREGLWVYGENRSPLMGENIPNQKRKFARKTYYLPEFCLQTFDGHACCGVDGHVVDRGLVHEEQKALRKGRRGPLS